RRDVDERQRVLAIFEDGWRDGARDAEVVDSRARHRRRHSHGDDRRARPARASAVAGPTLPCSHAEACARPSTTLKHERLAIRGPSQHVEGMHQKLAPPPLDAVLGSASAVAAGRLAGEGPAGRLPLTADMLRDEPSGNLFGLTP